MEKVIYTMFWDGPFSQWHHSIFTNEYGTFNCAEQYMMFRKALLFNDKETANKILDSNQPKIQKSLGRQVRNFQTDIWDKVSKDIVFHGNFCKFTQNQDLYDILTETDGTILVEASPYDTIWGIGLTSLDPKSLNKETWRGKNYLGYILTNLRNQLMQLTHTEE